MALAASAVDSALGVMLRLGQVNTGDCCEPPVVCCSPPITVCQEGLGADVEDEIRMGREPKRSEPSAGVPKPAAVSLCPILCPTLTPRPGHPPGLAVLSVPCAHPPHGTDLGWLFDMNFCVVGGEISGLCPILPPNCSHPACRQQRG